MAAEFVDRAGRIAATAAQIAKLQGASVEATVLEQARASLVETGYSGWNEGTTLFTLMLEVPIPTYATVEEQRDALEQSIQRRVAEINRVESGNAITTVVISPMLAEESRPVEPLPTDAPSEEIPSFWQAGFVRLFITHVATIKADAHRLKESLAQFQVAAFVAHDDIEPTREWQAEIERALRTMDALAAMISPGFLSSRWCDQEVGFAMGRGKLVIPLRLGADPHGFLGKYQGLSAAGADLDPVADKIAEILAQNPLSSARMSEALVDRLASSGSFAAARRNIGLLERVARLNASQIARLFRAIEENGQVGDAYGVPERIQSLASRVSVSTV